MPLTEHELDGQLHALKAPSPTIDRATARSLVVQAAEQASSRRRKRWTLTAAATLIAAAVAVPAGAIATQFFAAQTREFAAPGQTEVDAGDEWINPNTEDFGGFVRQSEPRDLQAPAGYDWEAASERIVKRYRTGEPTQLPDSLIVSDFTRDIWIEWISTWVDADRAGDETARATAFSALQQAPGWPGIADSDGGGIRYVMWAFLARMNTDDAVARSETGQALLQAEMDEPTDAVTARRAASWDGVDRQALINTIVDEWVEASGGPDVVIDDTFWDRYDEILREVAARAGVPDPAAAVGTRRGTPARAGDGVETP